jgi:hypothetical protein
MIPANLTYHIFQPMIEQRRSDEWNVYGQDFRAIKALARMTLRITLNAADVERMSKEVYTKTDWIDFIDDKGLEYYEDDYTPPPFYLKGRPRWVKTAWILSQSVEPNNVSPVNAALRDLLFYVKEIAVSKGMKEQHDSYNRGEIEWIQGVVEHCTPAKALAEKLAAAKTPVHMERIVDKHHKMAYVTRKEDSRIPKEYKSSLPENGTWVDRYRGNIEIYPHRVQIKTSLVPSGARVG